MADTDQIKEDEVLRRMLNTPHEKHKSLKEKGPRPSRAWHDKGNG